MRVQRLVMPITGAESWTALDDALVTVERHQEPSVGGRTGQDRWVVRAAKSLRPGGAHVMALDRNPTYIVAIYLAGATGAR
jgi:hypothetical protein